ncbi:hypothetical protein HDV00_001199 [Rhizophlyctis rosea]|nr:hypothetical protein HDV00_001199 [Rhizophlyctis rosea]
MSQTTAQAPAAPSNAASLGSYLTGYCPTSGSSTKCCKPKSSTPPPTTQAKGIDYSWARPSPSGIKSAGYSFVVRYFSHTTSKNLSAAEAKKLHAAGLKIVSNWEAGASNAKKGRAQGIADAKAAAAQHKAVGGPAGKPIYFSVDYDAPSKDQATLNAYFDGVASVIGRSRTGAYGSYNVIKRLLDAGKIKYAWQTYAWSGGKWDSRAHLRQTKNGITVAGSKACCDADTAMKSDYGQW